MTASASLAAGRDACERGAWQEAFDLLSALARVDSLEAADLERLATSAYLTGREDDFHELLARAHHAHVEAKDMRAASRNAFWIGLTLMLRGDTAVGGGWLARAERLIGDDDCAERGLLLLPVAERNLGEGHHETAHDTAVQAAEIGERFGDADLIACARHLQGRARIEAQQVRAGLALLDEAMLAVVAGELTPIMTGLIYCSVIETCQRVYALSRARQWTDALTTWCEKRPQMQAFRGTCLVCRAEIMQLSGAWSEAMDEAERACERLSHTRNPMRTAPALYRQAELQRLRGDLAAAEETYRTVSRLGCEPQPGLALLRLAQGRTDAASAALSRVLAATTSPFERTNLLAAQVEISIAVGNEQAATAACEELERIACQHDTEVLHATATRARGALELARGDARAALAPLRRAFDIWRELDVPYEAARVRALLGHACRATGDHDAAEIELDAAREMFEKLGAAAELASPEFPSAASDTKLPVSARELDVLRLVAAGKTNKQIATALFVSERTVDRHVSNILTKLGVPSRAAAAAYAITHKLLS